MCSEKRIVITSDATLHAITIGIYDIIRLELLQHSPSNTVNGLGMTIAWQWCGRRNPTFVVLIGLGELNLINRQG